MNLWPFSKKPKAVQDSHFDFPPGVVLAAPSEADNTTPAYFPQPEPQATASVLPFESPSPPPAQAVFQEEMSFPEASPSLSIEPDVAMTGFAAPAFEASITPVQPQSPLSSHLLDLLSPAASAEIGPWPGMEPTPTIAAEAAPAALQDFQLEPTINSVMPTPTPEIMTAKTTPAMSFETGFEAEPPVTALSIAFFEPAPLAETTPATESWGWAAPPETPATQVAANFTTAETGWETSFDEPVPPATGFDNVIAFPQEHTGVSIHSFTSPMGAELDEFGLATGEDAFSASSFLFEETTKEASLTIETPAGEDIDFEEVASTPDFLEIDMSKAEPQGSFPSESLATESLAPPAEATASWEDFIAAEPESLELTDDAECDGFGSEDSGPVGDMESYEMGYYDDPEDALAPLDLDQIDELSQAFGALPDSLPDLSSETAEDEVSSCSNVLPFARPIDISTELAPFDDAVDWEEEPQSISGSFRELSPIEMEPLPSTALTPIEPIKEPLAAPQTIVPTEIQASSRPSITGAIDSFEKQVILEDSRFIKRSIDELVERYFAQKNDEPAF